jgi:hypothetical protein
MIDAEVLEQFQLLVSMIEKLPTKEYVEERITKKIEESQRHLEDVIDKKIAQSQNSMEIAIANAVAQSHKELSSMISNLPSKEFVMGYVDEKVSESRRHTEILIENVITKRIDSLSDGHKLIREKQAELEQQNKAQQEKIEQRLYALENKPA